MLHRIFVKEGAAPELLRCIAARMHYPYLGQNKFEILTYRPRITKYAALLFPVSVQYPNAILCICHENGTELTFQAGRILSVAKFLQTRLTPEADRILSDQLSHILASVPNPETLNDRPYIRLLRMELCFLHIRQKLLPRADIPAVQERS